MKKTLMITASVLALVSAPLAANAIVGLSRPAILDSAETPKSAPAAEKTDKKAHHKGGKMHKAKKAEKKEEKKEEK